MSATALLFLHDRLVGAGRMPQILEANGFKIETRFTPEDRLDDIDPLAADLLVLMGGPKGAMAVYEAAQFPFLKTEMEMIAARVQAGRAVIGICLGAQMIAAALGARVYPGGKGREIGWRDLQITPEGENHAAAQLAGKIMQWHGDTFDLPPGAALLASSDQYAHQIFSCGKNILGLQCHPEIMKEQARLWIEKLDDRQAQEGGETLDDARARLLDDTLLYADGLGTRMQDFMEAWLRDAGLTR